MGQKQWSFPEILAELENRANLPNFSTDHSQTENVKQPMFNTKMDDHLGSVHFVFVFFFQIGCD